MNEPFVETPAWLLKRVDNTESTNDLARDLRPWQAIFANSQSSGRGRHRRRFVCAPGGIWLSAVVPIPGGPQRWTGLALAVGWGLLGWLQSLPGLHREARKHARLRWPNDIMIGSKKLGGILLEQSTLESCIVGVGINVSNNPADDDPSLINTTTSLCDWLPSCPAAADLIPGVLEGIAAGWSRMEKHGLAGMMPELNECWGGPREVEVRPLEGSPVLGTLWGIDEEGAIVIRLPEGGGRTFPAHHIERMIEI